MRIREFFLRNRELELRSNATRLTVGLSYVTGGPRRPSRPTRSATAPALQGEVSP